MTRDMDAVTLKLRSTELDMLVIYDKPTDCPTKFVVRRWWISFGDPEADITMEAFDTIDEARAHVTRLRPFAVCLVRDPSDEPQIVETWI